MFSQDAEQPLTGSTRMSQDILLWEVRETAGRVSLKEREPGKAFLGGRGKLSARLGKVAIGKTVRLMGSSKGVLSNRKVWPASVSP